MKYFMKNIFDFIAPVYERVHYGALETFKELERISGGFNGQDVVIDLGGGTGRIAKFLAGKVKSITVFDLSEEMIKQCQNHSSLVCVVASGESLPIENNFADKIIIVDAFHHIKNQEAVIKEVKRVLKPQGRVLIEEFNPLVFWGKLAVLAEKILGLGSIFHKHSALADLFSKQGFRVKIFNENKSSYCLVAEK